LTENLSLYNYPLRLPLEGLISRTIFFAVNSSILHKNIGLKKSCILKKDLNIVSVITVSYEDHKCGTPSVFKNIVSS
jgi:hypothetical protein